LALLVVLTVIVSVVYGGIRESEAQSKTQTARLTERPTHDFGAITPVDFQRRETARSEIILTAEINSTPTSIKPSTEIPEPSSLSTQIYDEFGTSMALVPSGEFWMGSSFGEENETPVHQVYLDAFFIDIYEITNQ
jgi:formylglycine-generating enzyme required for sulfatase activity